MRKKNSSELAATSKPSHTVLDRLNNDVTTNIAEVKLDDIVVDTLGGPLIEEGVYQARYRSHETKTVFGTPKVFVHFEIVEQGKNFGTKLFRAFRVSELIGKPGRGGRFKLNKRSELLLELCRLYQKQGLRPDRISLQPLKHVILKVRVRTVRKDYLQKDLPEMLWYSVIGGFISIEAGTLT